MRPVASRQVSCPIFGRRRRSRSIGLLRGAQYCRVSNAILSFKHASRVAELENAGEGRHLIAAAAKIIA